MPLTWPTAQPDGGGTGPCISARAAEWDDDESDRPAGTETLSVCWLGDPQQGFGGMGQSGRLGFSSGGYAYAPVGGASSLDGVRIPIWSTKALTARWFGPSPAVVETDLRPAGPDRLAGTVTNRLDVPLHDALLVYGKQVYILGTIAPNATVRVETAQDRFLSGQLNDAVGRYGQERPWTWTLDVTHAGH